MSLKSLLMETSDAPRACGAWLLLIAAALIAFVWDACYYNLKTDGPVLTLESNAVLRQRFDRDTICTDIHAGDSVRVLGIERTSFGQKWLVRTSGGDIGLIDGSDLTGIRQIVTDGPNKGDTVAIRAHWLGSSIYRYYYTGRDGEEKERSTRHFMPVLDGWQDYQYESDAVAGICTQQRFEKMTAGKSLADVNDAFGLPVLLRVTPSGFTARYSWKVYDPATGEMSRPNVSFGKDSLVTGVEYTNTTDRAASWLRHMPLAPQILDWPVTTVLMRGSRYVMFSNPLPGTFEKVLQWCLMPVVLILMLLWLFWTASLPVVLMGWLLRFPVVFAWISDRWLKWLMLAVTLVSAYVWSVMQMGWGIFPVWSVVIFIVSWYMFTLAASPLCTFPHCRCPQCHHMYTIHFDRSEFDYDEIVKGSDIVRGRKLGTRTEKWRTWTQVNTTRTYSDGSKHHSSHRENERRHSRDYNMYEYLNYDVTYRLDHYRDYYRCSCCGFEEEDKSVVTTELGRKFTGTHTGEEAGEERVSRW